MNTLAPWVDPRVKLVRTGHLLRYLRKQGWIDDGIVRKFFHRLHHPVKKAPVFVPTAEETDDTPICIFEAVTELARIEERFAGDVLNDLLAQPADTESKPNLSTTSAKTELAHPVNR